LALWKTTFVCMVPPSIGSGCAKTTAARGSPSGLSKSTSSVPAGPAISRTSANASLLGRVGRVRWPDAPFDGFSKAGHDARELIRRTARHGAIESDRKTALAALALSSDAGDQRTLWRATVLDPSTPLRAAAVDLTRTHSAPRDVIAFLAPALVHDAVDVRIRTAEALAGLGDPAAIGPIAAAAPTAVRVAAAQPGATRAYIAFLQQQSYIRDFEVEVAQAAFIADPKVDVLQSGTVLDVTVASVITERVVTTFRRALTKLAGADPGGDPAAWSSWAAGLPQAPEAPAR